ncbi:MAG: polymer-forming cytoskeletal protein [Lachnospiraceae bacterium]|nr:polymer-forming cytoskeletal protein [Lachnospiraceae bacterium]
MEEIPETAAEEIPAEEPVIEEAVAEEIPAEEPVMEEIPEPAVEEPAPELDAVLEASLDEAFAPIEAPVREPEPEVTAQEPEAPAFETEYTYSASKGAEKEMDSVRDYSEETSVITGGMTINGDLETEGSLDLVGDVNGNVSVKGKLNVTGHINGNSQAKEVYAEGAKITGDISSETAVKIGTGTVIIGNISALSAAIAGAVKGDIDVHGPVILDSTAIVMGNIKSKSVQINNGAAIEGMCSQCYADVSPTSFFDEYKTEKKAAKGGKGAKNADTTEA